MTPIIDVQHLVKRCDGLAAVDGAFISRRVRC